jgi:hypothetical protein
MRQISLSLSSRLSLFLHFRFVGFVSRLAPIWKRLFLSHSSFVSCPHHWTRPLFPTISRIDFYTFTIFTKAECFCLCSCFAVTWPRAMHPTLVLSLTHYPPPFTKKAVRRRVDDASECVSCALLPSLFSFLHACCPLQSARIPLEQVKTQPKVHFTLSLTPTHLFHQKLANMPPTPLSLCRLYVVHLALCCIPTVICVAVLVP